MRVDAILREIQALRERLDEIAEERAASPADARAEEIAREEKELRARLMRLQDASIKERDTQELPGVPGFTPPQSKPPI